jgi:exopolyphosphatase/guanosine-5'-triphosphate,3'-diphosphate pyrophosphatase
VGCSQPTYREESDFMIVAIIDVGSNSVRLLVAAVEGRDVKQLHRERVYERLGDDAYRLGRIGSRKLEETRSVAKRFSRIARKRGAERLETIVTASGRQSENRDELVDLLRKATQSPVAALTADDEGRLAWEGAVARMDDPPEIVAVVDLGGGSCELAVGAPPHSPAWVRSVDAGALRVTRAFLGGNPPSRKRVANARCEIGRLFDDFDPPRPDAALAAGGTARAIGRIVGKRFGVGQLEKLAATLGSVPAETVTESHGVTLERAETLLGGTLVLTEIARSLDCDLEVSRGGLREGAALALAHAAVAAA